MTQEYSDPNAGALSALLDTARVPDAVRDDMRAFEEDRAPTVSGHDDGADQSSGTEELRRIWGTDFEPNMDRVRAYVQRLPDDELAVLNDARDSSGRLLGNDPAHVVRIAGLARAPQPEQMTIAGIERFMRTNRAAYNRDAVLQARYRELIDARLRAGGS